MPVLTLTEAEKQAIRNASSAEAACHTVCDATDDAFYFGHADDITGWIRDVLCVETFFGAMCDGGITTWFDWDHGRLAHLVPSALHAVGLPEYEGLAHKALAVHTAPPFPPTIQGWSSMIEKVRDTQLEDDFNDEVYDPIEKEFFALYHASPTHFRTKLHEYVLAHLDD